MSKTWWKFDFCLCHHQPSRKLRRFHLPLPLYQENSQKHIFRNWSRDGRYLSSKLFSSLRDWYCLLQSILIKLHQSGWRQKSLLTLFTGPLAWDSKRTPCPMNLNEIFGESSGLSWGTLSPMVKHFPIERWLNTVSWYQSSQYLSCRYTCTTIYIYYIRSDLIWNHWRSGFVVLLFSESIK